MQKALSSVPVSDVLRTQQMLAIVIIFKDFKDISSYVFVGFLRMQHVFT